MTTCAPDTGTAPRNCSALGDVVEHAESSPDAELAVTQRIPRESEPRTEVVLVGAVGGCANALVARKYKSHRRRREHRRLLPRDESVLPIVQLGQRSAVVIAKADIHGEVASDFEIVLGEHAEELVAVALLVRIRLIVKSRDKTIGEVVDRVVIGIALKSRQARHQSLLGSGAGEVEVAVVDEIEELVLLIGAIFHAELHGVTPLDPGETVGVLPGIVAARLGTLVSVAQEDTVDLNNRGSGRGGIVRNNPRESQLGRSSPVVGNHAGRVIAMERGERLIDEVWTKSVSVMQRDVVVRIQVQLSEAGHARSLEREGSMFGGSLREKGNREIVPFRKPVIDFEQTLVAVP